MNWKMVLIAILAIGLLVGTAHAVTIDFDDVVPGPLSGDHYLSQGVLLSTDGTGLYTSVAATMTNTPPNFLLATAGLADADIIIDFVVPGTTTPAVTNYVSFYLYDAETGEGDPWTVQAFDVNLFLLVEVSGTSNDEGMVSIISNPDPVIHRVVFSSSTDLEGIDTLEFNTPVAAVPEPTTILLLGVGLAGVGLLRRRFKN